MYSYEQRKRKGLLSLAKLILLFIVITIVLILTQKEPSKTGLSCNLAADKTPVNGVYKEPITVTIEVSGDKEIVSKNVGLYQNGRRNREEYTLSTSGITTLVGYVEDEDGVSAACLGTFELSLSSPSCELMVLNGTLGLNDWYTSDVTVSFKNMSSNQRNIKISKYSITKSIKDLDTDKELSETDEINDNLEITNNGNYVLIGRVEDERGNVGECKLDVSIDKDPPVCELNVIDRDTDNKLPVVVGFKNASDYVSDIYEKGVGEEKTFKDDTYSIISYGTNKVYGYVKDYAGNENTCELEVVTVKDKEEVNNNEQNVIIINNDIKDRVVEFFEN